MQINKRKIFKIITLSFLLSNTIYSKIYAQNLGIVKSDGVNVRSLPTKYSDIITKLNTGKNLEILEIKDKFFKVNLNGKDAYISNDFIELSKVESQIKGDNVNIREYPSTDSKVIGKLLNSENICILGKTDSWYLIEFNGATGFVNKDFVITEYANYIKDINIHSKKKLDELSAVVKTDSGLKLREEASLNSNVLNVIPKGNTLDVLDIDNNWVKVSYSDKLGYVNADYISLTTLNSNKNDYDKIANDIINFSKRFLGTPYVWGGTDLNTGVDCSGFVYSVFKSFGIDLNRSSNEMIFNGTNIDKSELKKGDILFFNTSGDGISHVGIYIDNGNFIHSSSTKKQGVIISNMNDGYYSKNYVKATRVL